MQYGVFDDCGQCGLAFEIKHLHRCLHCDIKFCTPHIVVHAQQINLDIQIAKEVVKQ